MRQIVLNLVGNSVKFTERGHVMLELERVGERVVLRVVDSGPGIPLDRQGRLFEPFTQSDVSMSRRHGGTGLGLAISRRLAHGMGGDLVLRSALGEGSTFELTLPLEQAAPQPQGRPLEGRRVLVSEPSAAQRRILVEQLAAAGAQVESASTADAAREALNEPFDAVVWAETLLPAALPASVGHVVQMAGRARSGRWNVVPRPCRSALLVDAVLSAIAHPHEEWADARRTVPLSSATPAARSHHATVLVVDDNSINLRVATAMLERLGCHVTTATNGQNAIDSWKAGKWDLVFMDCQMPEVDGYEATAQVRALEAGSRRTPIVAMTANAGVEDRVRCLSAGMDGFIAKPCRSRDFEDALAQWLTQRAA